MQNSRDDFVIAIRSAFLKKDNQQRFSLFSLILFSIFFLVLGHFNFKIVQLNRTIIKEIAYISSFIVTIPESTIKKSINSVVDHFGHYNNYLDTKKELQVLKNKDLSKKIITYENIELKKLIEDYFVEDSQVYAKVLIDKESPFLRSIIINKGSKNDIRIGMIAYSGKYLVGKVVEVNFLTSRVLLISDLNSKVPVTIQPLNIQAIMSGSDVKRGVLQYIKDEKIISNKEEELIVVTSGAGGVFKSGIPIGKVNLTEIKVDNEIIIDFYKDFSQLKYVKILSYKKEIIKLDSLNKIKFDNNEGQISQLKNQEENIKLLQQQNIIIDDVRKKLTEENSILNKKVIDYQKKIGEQKKLINKNSDVEFLELNLLWGHKCRKTFLRSNRYEINTPEYRSCVFNKGVIKAN